MMHCQYRQPSVRPHKTDLYPEGYGVKSFKTILTGTIIAGLLLVSVNGAMAAYSGLYVNQDDKTLTVGLGADYFDINGGNVYAVTLQGNLWSAEAGPNDYFYGANVQDKFAFFHSTAALDASAIGTITGAVSAFVTSSIALLPLAQQSPILFELLLNQGINALLGDLSQYNLIGSLLGYGSFAPDGNSFDVTVGTFDAAGIRSLLCENCTETYVKATPIPGAAWLLGSGLIGLVGLRRRMRG